MKRIVFLMSLFSMLFITACGDASSNSSTPHEEAAISVEDKEEVAKEVPGEDTGNEEESATQMEEAEGLAIVSELDELSVHFIDVGQADATLFRYSDDDKDYAILFDAGDWRGNEVVPYLQSQGITSIDLVVISHPDADHIGQLESVMHAFHVDEVWMSGNESSSETFQRAIEAVLTSDADYYEPRAGESFQVGPLEVDILYPESISGKSNEESIAALFTYGNVKFLLTGDAGRYEESYMRTNFDVQADVLQLGHHGSKTSTEPAFLDAVSPSIAVYSAGAGNSYGHPSPEVVATIKQRNIELYGTDTHGTIIITTDGEEIGTVGSEQVSQNKTAARIAPSTRENTQPDTNNETKPAKPIGNCININEASAEVVQEIIHIGPERAEELIDRRPYDSVDELTRIHGIGNARIADIKSEGKACVQ